MQVDVAVFVEAQTKKTDNLYTDQMESDFKLALQDLSARVSSKSDANVLERLRESSHIDAQSSQSAIKALSNSVARLEAQVCFTLVKLSHFAFTIKMNVFWTLWSENYFL